MSYSSTVFALYKFQAIRVEGFDLDAVLLRISACHSILYGLFIIITGSFASHRQFGLDQVGGLHIADGILEIAQIVLQLVFLDSLKEKVSKYQYPLPKPKTSMGLVTAWENSLKIKSWLHYFRALGKTTKWCSRRQQKQLPEAKKKKEKIGF